jgi:type II secretory pathway component PulJ
MMKTRRGFTVLELVMAIGLGSFILLLIGLFLGLCYVALHFLMKVW